MGKIKCSSCKKNFDYDMYYGICPKCAVYNRKQSANEVQNPLYTGHGNNYTEADNNYTGYADECTEYEDDECTEYEDQYTYGKLENTTSIDNAIEENRADKKEKRRTILVIAVAGIIFAVTILSSKVNQMKMDVLYETKPNYTEGYEIGQVIPMKGVDATVLGAKTIVPIKEGIVPEDKKIVGIEMQFEITKDKVVIPSPGIFDENGVYLEHLGSWKIQEELIGYYSDINLVEDYYGAMNSSVSGYYCYLVDKDTTQILLLLQEEDEFKDREYVTNNHQIKVIIEGGN